MPGGKGAKVRIVPIPASNFQKKIKDLRKKLTDTFFLLYRCVYRNRQLFAAERYMALEKIAEYRQDRGSKCLGRRSPETAKARKKMQQGIVQDNIETLQGRVAKQLYPPFQVRLLEDHELRQEKTDGKADQEGNGISRDITGHRNAGKIDKLIVQYIVIANKINDKPQHRNAAAASQVPECL